MFLKGKKLRLLYFLYWVLLSYIIAALIWWFISLKVLNNQMAQNAILNIKKDDVAYKSKIAIILIAKEKKDFQYISEGLVFFILILSGAIFIFNFIRLNFKYSVQQQRFLMALTHELKTPIAVTSLNLETLLKRKLDESQKIRILQTTLQEANRLNTLCNNILLSSQIEADGYNFTNSDLNFTELVQSSSLEFANRFPDRKFDIDIVPDINIHGDEMLMQLAVNNLLDNAIKYSPKEESITIKLFSCKNKIAILEIIDKGKGIDDKEKNNIFKKFYRIGNETTKAAKGTGLGLYLTKKIIKQHKGEIVITDNVPTGSVFTLKFKLVNDINL